MNEAVSRALEHRGCSLVKSRVSVTIDGEFIKWVDGKIEEKIFANRSHAIEYAIKQLIDKERSGSRKESSY